MPGSAPMSGGAERGNPDGASAPRVVAGYRLLRRLGEGGMSEVYLSYDVPARRPVAVKLLADHLAGRREFVSRFHREARLSQHLCHPNLVRGFATGYDPAAGKLTSVAAAINDQVSQEALTPPRKPVPATRRLQAPRSRAFRRTQFVAEPGVLE